MDCARWRLGGGGNCCLREGSISRVYPSLPHDGVVDYDYERTFRLTTMLKTTTPTSLGCMLSLLLVISMLYFYYIFFFCYYFIYCFLFSFLFYYDGLVLVVLYTTLCMCMISFYAGD